MNEDEEDEEDENIKYVNCNETFNLQIRENDESKANDFNSSNIYNKIVNEQNIVDEVDNNENRDILNAYENDANLKKEISKKIIENYSQGIVSDTIELLNRIIRNVNVNIKNVLGEIINVKYYTGLLKRMHNSLYLNNTYENGNLKTLNDGEILWFSNFHFHMY